MVASNKELQEGLKAIAEDFHLPGGGRMKLSKLIARHMAWFEVAERRGMGWRDIARALSGSGITSETGQPLSIGTLSSTVWRHRAAEIASINGRNEVGQQPAAKLAVVHAKRPKSTMPTKARIKPRKNRAELRSGNGQNDGQPKAATKSKRSKSEPAGESENVMAFMARAREVRRRSE
jgi:hypothetical protein